MDLSEDVRSGGLVARRCQFDVKSDDLFYITEDVIAIPACRELGEQSLSSSDQIWLGESLSGIIEKIACQHPTSAVRFQVLFHVKDSQ